MIPPLSKLSVNNKTTNNESVLVATPEGDAEPPLAPPPPPGKAKKRARRGATLLCGCNLLACLLALLIMLPHQQPFHPSLLLYCTVWLWWSIPVLLAVALVCVCIAVLFCMERRAGGRVVAPIGLLVVGPLLFAFACGWFFGLEEHGFMNWKATALGETGFLKLCHVWCGAGPWAIRSPCYQDSDAAWRNNTSAAEALAFFHARVFGPAGDQVATWGLDGRIALSGLSALVAVQHPGRRTLLISSGLGSGWQSSGWSHVAVPFRGRISEHAARLNAVAALLRDDYEKLVVYGCSVTAKVAYLAAATAPPGTYSQALIDSGGALGPASVKVVGPCGETWAAMLGRWPQWVAASARDTPPPSEWPADVGDLIVEACKHTRFRFGVGRYNQWNNYEGTMKTVQTARNAGCTVDVYEGYVAHCGYFFPGTCAHSC